MNYKEDNIDFFFNLTKLKRYCKLLQSLIEETKMEDISNEMKQDNDLVNFLIYPPEYYLKDDTQEIDNVKTNLKIF